MEDAEFHARAFECPRCGVLAAQRWFVLKPESIDGRTAPTTGEIGAFHMARCKACSKVSVWQASPSPGSALRGRMVYPLVRAVGTDLPEEAPAEIRELWDQARDVAALNVPAAAALLRIALQRMLQLLAPNEEDLADAVAVALPGGVPEPIRQAMDLLGLTGDDSQHVAELRLDDDIEMLPALFALIRYLVDATYVATARAFAAFASLPDFRHPDARALEGEWNRDFEPTAGQPASQARLGAGDREDRVDQSA